LEVLHVARGTKTSGAAATQTKGASTGNPQEPARSINDETHAWLLEEVLLLQWAPKHPE